MPSAFGRTAELLLPRSSIKTSIVPDYFFPIDKSRITVLINSTKRARNLGPSPALFNGISWKSAFPQRGYISNRASYF